MAVELVLLSRASYRDKEITGRRMRGLFALLAGDLRTGCGTARLVTELWWDERPENPAKALQILVSRARAQFGADLIASTTTGYRLTLAEDAVDASAILLSMSAGALRLRDSDFSGALTHAEAGLALWNGSAESGTDPLAALRMERQSAHRSLVRTRALALSRLGRRADALEPLTEVFQELPRDEEVLVELLRCEAPPAALRRYETYRRELRDELGADPGRALQEMHQNLLHGEAPVVRSGIPHEPNTLIGRDEDIAAVLAMISSSRVTSIVGAGGLGKTRLAHTVSRQAEQPVVHFVALASVEDVIGAVASALDVGTARILPDGRPVPPVDLVTGIVSALRQSPALLVLDNCEHVVSEAAELVHTLVAKCENLRVLTTSRAPLGLSSESVYLLPELSLDASVELFQQRAKAIRSTVDMPVHLVAELCRRLDGLPLAVELAAARVRVLSVAELAKRLEDRFSLLRGGSRDAPERHRTLQAVIDWSWNLLDPTGQAAMRALSIFPGGFTADAAAVLLETSDCTETLEQLTDQSLLKVTDTPSGTRFQMLETVREFSASLRDAAETDKLIHRFLAWAIEFGVANHDSFFGLEVVRVSRLFRAEQDNMLQALRWAVELNDGAAVAATTAVLGALWTIESAFARMLWLIDQVEWLLSHYRPEPAHIDVARSAAMICVLNRVALQAGNPARFLVVLRRLPMGKPNTLPRAVQVALRAESMESLCDNDDPTVAWLASGFVAYQFEYLKQVEPALRAAERMLAAAYRMASPGAQAVAHGQVGGLLLGSERGREARHHLMLTLPLLSEVGAVVSSVRLRWMLALAALQIGDFDDALRWVDEATALAGGDDPIGQGMRAEIMLARGEVEAGLRSWRRVADRLRDGVDSVVAMDPVVHRPWRREIQAVAVVAHARHGQIDLVVDIADELPAALASVLGAESTTEQWIRGSLLLALGMTEIARGRPAPGVRLIALAEAVGFTSQFHPTMSTTGARQAAEDADAKAYAEAKSAYASLDHDGLRMAALAAVTTPDRA